MITFRFSECSLIESRAQSFAFFVTGDQIVSKELEEVSKHYFPALENYLKHIDFTGQKGKVVALSISVKDQPKTIFCVGLGKAADQKIDLEQLRRSTGSLIKA